MRVISFFTAKGGTGKSTFNMLLASFLQYEQGKRVIVLDFDAPEYNLTVTRRREMDAARRAGREIDEATLYPIESIEVLSIEELRQLAGNLAGLAERFDYLIMDFKGSFLKTDAVFQMVVEKCLDLVVVPVELDGMSIASCYSLGNIFHQLDQRMLVFFNRVVGRENPKMYEQFADFFAKGGIPLSDCRIKNTVKMRRDSDAVTGFVRSSICFPDKEIRAVNPEIVKLFNEVLDYVGKEEETAAG